MPSPDVFLSYSRDDRDRIAPLAEELKSDDQSIWWDDQIPLAHRFVT